MGIIKVKKLNPKAILPTKGTRCSVGFDLYARIDNDVIISDRITFITTSIAIEIPVGYYGQIRSRSGLYKDSILCTHGTIDSDYRGEIIVGLYTTTSHTIVKSGDRIAQLIIARVEPFEMEWSNNLGETERGENGFGSTGR